MKPLSTGGRWSGSAGSAGISITFLTAHLSPSRYQVQIEDERFFEADDAIDEAVGLGRIVRRPQLEHQLILVAEVDGLQMLARVQIPEVQPAAVFGAEQHLGNQAVLEGIGRAPLAGHHGVVTEMPPGVIGELLRAAIHLPAGRARRKSRGPSGTRRPAPCPRGCRAPRHRCLRVRSARCAGACIRPGRRPPRGSITLTISGAAGRAWCRGCGCAKSAGPARRDSAARCADAARWGRDTTSRRSSRSDAVRRRHSASPRCRRSWNSWRSRDRRRRRRSVGHLAVGIEGRDIGQRFGRRLHGHARRRIESGVGRPHCHRSTPASSWFAWND